MSELPERTGPRPDAIDVAGVEEAPAVRLGPAPAGPQRPAGTAEGRAAERQQRPPRRHLSSPELIEEGTKLVVGSVLLAGRGLRALIEFYADDGDDPDPSVADERPTGTEVATRPADARSTSRQPAAPREPRTTGEAPATDEPAPPEPGPAAAEVAAEPTTVLAALPLALLGAGLAAQRRVVSAAFDAQERLGPAVSWWLDRPVVSPAYRRLRAQVFEWHRMGRSDADASRAQALAVMGGGADEGLGFVYENLDLNTITAGFDVTPLIQNLELNDIIMQSTGGLATEAIDAVRAQGVMVDDVLERITGRIFRRRAQRVPKGPPGRYGPAERFPDRRPS